MREQIAAAAARLPRGLGRVVPAANYHITLEFIGTADADLRARLETAAGRLSLAGFRMRLQRFGHWPRARVVWLGPDHLPPELLALAYQLRAVSEVCGLQPEQRPYRPHVTLVRKAGRAPEWPGIEPVDWPVKDFVLCASHSTSKDPQYEILKHWPLSPGTNAG